MEENTSPSDTTTVALTEFVDNTEQVTTEPTSEMDPSRYETSVSGDSIDTFFERPILLQSWLWQVGSGLDVTLNPWEMWITNKRVANRVANYANFKGRLHLKFVLNGNAFYWGRAYSSYTMYNKSPWVNYEDTPLDIIPSLQRPHLWLDASTSQAGELVLPFFHPQDCLDLQGTTDFRDMGTLWLKSLSSLRHANGSTRPISIQMFAWVEDINLSTLTQNTATLSPQAGMMPQAGESSEGGPISKPASALAKVAGALSKAPGIGPYALATQTMANAIGSTARLFGYSRPRVLDTPKPVSVQQTGNLASTDMDEAVTTLALTSQQEISVDPRIVGLDSTDEMSFGYLAGKWSYFAKFPWALSRSLNYPLFSVAVSPIAFGMGNRVLSPATKNGFALTSMALTAMPFDFWRGTIRYKFQVICSAYHKGRLLVTWEPRGIAAAVPEMNTVQSTVIDISETTEFEIEVGWGARTPGLHVMSLVTAETLGGLRHSMGALFPCDPVHENGTINVYVLNDLVTSGSDTNDIEVLVSARSDDLELWSPTQLHINPMTFEPPLPAMEAQGAVLGDETSSILFGRKYSKSIPTICSGETITSFRALLKRYVLKRLTMTFGELPDLSIILFALMGSSYLGNFYELDIGMDVQYFILNCYCGWRGSTRHKYMPGNKSFRNSDYLSYYQSLTTRTSYLSRWDFVPRTVINSKEALCNLYKTYANFTNGGVMSKMADTDATEIEQPFYASQRFATNDTTTYTTGLGHTMTSIISNNSGAPRGYEWRMHHFTAIGEDFGAFGYIGPPAMWVV